MLGFKFLAPVAAAIALAFALPGAASAAATNLGPKVCGDCHKSEKAVWDKTQHAKGFNEIHKNKKAKDIIAAVGGEKNLRKNTICVNCHATLVGGKAEVGPSCESCHGAGSAYKDIHNKKDVAKEERVKQAQAAGMIWSFMHYDIASNCMDCHGMSKLDGATIDKMLTAGHPINGDYELVAYSQGQVRHRFYPPDITKNAEMTPAEKSRFLVIGAAAAFVDATEAVKKTTNATWVAAQNKRLENAKKILAAVPDAAGLLKAPTMENGRKLADAIKDKDLSAQVGKMVPTSFK